MYPISESYITQLATGILENKQLIGTIRLLTGEVIPLSNSDFANASVVIDNKCDSNSNICIGSAYVGKLSLGLFGDYDRYTLNKANEGAVIQLTYKLKEQEIPLGIFNVYECTRKGNKLTINAYDNMTKLDKSLNTNNTNGSVLDILKWISSRCGVEFSNTDDEILSFVNSNVICNITSDNFKTYQAVLSEICELMGVFSYADRNGKILLKRYGEKSVFKLQNAMRKTITPSDYDVYYTELVETDLNGLVSNATSGDASGLTYNIDNKLVAGTNSAKKTIVRNIMNELAKIKYIPCDLSIMFNPAFDLGDKITILADGKVLLEDIDIIITEYKYGFNGTSTLKSVGSNRLLSTSGNKTNSGYSSSYNTLKKNGTYIATYENVSNYEINSNKTLISAIDFSIGESDKVTISGQCQIDVKTAGTVKIIYVQNEEENTFMPEEYLTTGKHIINFSNWFDIKDTDQYNTYSIYLTSEDGLIGNINIDKVKTYVLASSVSEGKFYANNIFFEEIDFRKYTNNDYPLGYIGGEDE